MRADLGGVQRASVLYVSALAWIAAYFLPYDVMAMVARLGLNEEQAGWIASAELLILSLTAAFMSSRIAALDKRLAIVASSIAGALATIGMIVFSSIFSVIVAKLVFGISIGVLVACSYGLIPHFRHPEKIIGQSAIVLPVMFGGAMFVIPVLTENVSPYGLEVVQLLLMLMGVVAGLKAPAMKGVTILAATESGSETRLAFKRIVFPLLISIFALFVSQGASIGFVGTAGDRVKVTGEILGAVLSSMSLLQLAAGVFVNWLGDRAGYLKPIIGGLLILIASSLGMYCVVDSLVFVAAATMLNLGATLANTYMLSVIAELDESGRSSALAGAATTFGTAIGPALAGFAFMAGGLTAIGWFSAGMLGVAAFLAHFACRALAGRMLEETVTPLV